MWSPLSVLCGRAPDQLPLNDGLIKRDAVLRNTPRFVISFDELESIARGAGGIQCAWVYAIVILCFVPERNIKHVHLCNGRLFRLFLNR